MPKVDVHDELADLINKAANEDLAALESETVETNDTEKLFNHPWMVAFSWMLCLSVSVYLYLEPLPNQEDLGVRSVETRLNVAMYHVAYQVESFRNQTGQLPDYLEDEWNESAKVEYKIGANGYELHGRSGEFELLYLEGQDPEQLIGYATRKAD
jgi:hypothetical protein